MFDNCIFDKIDTEEKAYWLGFLEADGCVHSGNGDFRIELGLKAEDYHHLEKFKKFIGKNNKISWRASTKSYRFNFRDKKIHSDLIRLGCVPKKSLILNFPNESQVPDNLLKHFIRGYFDGDGSFWFEGKQFGLNILSSSSFLNGLKKRIKIFSDISIYPVHYERPNGAYRIQTGSSDVINAFLEWIYKDSNIYLDRKYQKYLKYYATL